MEIHNLIEDEVLNVLNSVLFQINGQCTCKRCQMDIIAIALNNLAPNYVVTEEGYAYAKANNMNLQFNTNVVTAITKAIEIVGKNPHHDE